MPSDAAIAVGSVVVGFGLQVVRDEVRRSRDHRERDLRVVRSVRLALDWNLASIEANQEIEKELAILPAKVVITPLVPVGLEVADIFRAHVPKDVGSGLINHLIEAEATIKVVAALMNSREVWKLSSTSLSNFHDRLERFDRALMENNKHAETRLNPLLKQVLAVEQRLEESTLERYYREAGRV